MDSDTAQRPASGHRSFLPHRSRGDRKLAGVAGGLGRAFGIDPVLIRVAFVVLAVFGGSGVLLYCLGWLLMPADGDEVSAVEALAGRGQSSVSTALTIVLIIVGLSSAGSVFSWGLPFWPVVIAAIIVFVLVRHGQRGSCSRSGSRGGDREGGDGGRDWGRDWGRRADEFAERAAAWGSRAGDWADRWAGSVRGSGDEAGGGWSRATGRPSPSPFGRPAFWERGGGGQGSTATAPGRDPAGWAAPDPATRRPSGSPDAPNATSSPTTPAPPAPADQGSVGRIPGPAGTGADVPGATAFADAPSPEDLLTQGRRTPPSWDPLGAAPFAWDLPDPTTTQSAPAATGPARGRGVPGRLFLGLALVTGGLLAGGVFAGWWALGWGTVAGITLAVIGLGLLVTSLRGTGGRPLIGPGIFLALVTLGLTVTGLHGTAEYGQHTWTPTTIAAVDGQSFHWNAGQATLDLSKLTIDKGRTVTTGLSVNGGQATILVPKGVRVEATCSARVGDVDCLGTSQNGLRPEATGHQNGNPDRGTLKIEVRSNAGQAEVRSHG